MKIIDTPLVDCKIIEPAVRWDKRGFFMESWKESSFMEAGIDVTFVQDNHSKSDKWVLRGLHFQTRKPQAKLVRVTAGAAFDVAVDCRKGSPTYWKRFGLVLSAENKKQLFVPRWFAHGFLSLEEGTEFLYKVDDVYDAWGEDGLMRNDSEIGIEWETVMKEYNVDLQEIQLSDKDTKYSTFWDLPKYFGIQRLEKNIEVFIDTQNVRQTFKYHGRTIDWQRFYVYLQDQYKVQSVHMFLGYLEKRDSFYQKLHSRWYELHFKSTQRVKWKVKWNVDAELVLEAMKRNNTYSKAILITSDGDFACLAHELSSVGKLWKILSPHIKYCSKRLKEPFLDLIDDIFAHRNKFATKIEQ